MVNARKEFIWNVGVFGIKCVDIHYHGWNIVLETNHEMCDFISFLKSLDNFFINKICSCISFF